MVPCIETRAAVSGSRRSSTSSAASECNSPEGGSTCAAASASAGRRTNLVERLAQSDDVSDEPCSSIVVLIRSVDNPWLARPAEQDLADLLVRRVLELNRLGESVLETRPVWLVEAQDSAILSASPAEM